MGLRDEAAEPWGLLLGASAGGLAWATGVPLPVAALIGVAAYVTKVGTAMVERRRGKALPSRGQPLAVNKRATEGAWLERGRQAAKSFDDLARSLDAGPLAEKVAAMRAPVTDAVGTLERLAGQASAAGNALARLDDNRLAAEVARLRDERSRATGEAAEYFDRAL